MDTNIITIPDSCTAAFGSLRFQAIGNLGNFVSMVNMKTKFDFEVMFHQLPRQQRSEIIQELDITKIKKMKLRDFARRVQDNLHWVLQRPMAIYHGINSSLSIGALAIMGVLIATGCVFFQKSNLKKRINRMLVDQLPTEDQNRTKVLYRPNNAPPTPAPHEYMQLHTGEVKIVNEDNGRRTNQLYPQAPDATSITGDCDKKPIPRTSI